MALWYFSYIIKGNVRSARSWVRCTVRLLICLHMCQIFINVFQTMIYQPRVNQNSLKCPLYGQTLPLWNLIIQIFRTMVLLSLSQLHELQELSEERYSQVKYFFCLLACLFGCLKSVAASAHYWILLSRLTKQQHLWVLIEFSSVMMRRWKGWQQKEEEQGWGWVEIQWYDTVQIKC